MIREKHLAYQSISFGQQRKNLADRVSNPQGQSRKLWADCKVSWLTRACSLCRLHS